MDGAHPQRRGWLSWLRYPLWNSPSPPSQSTASITATAPDRSDKQTKGLFFPFLVRGREKEMGSPAEVHGRERPEAERRPLPPSQRKPRTRNGPRGGGRSRGGRGSLGERTPVRVSRRRASLARAREVQRLHKDLPLIWQFLRDEEGWAFVKNTWNVRGPVGEGSSGGGGGADCGGAEQQQQAGPMPQGEVPSYLADCRELLERYNRWRGELPTGIDSYGKILRGRARSGSDAPAAPGGDDSGVRRARRASPPPPPLPLPMSALISMSPPVEVERRRCHGHDQEQQAEQQQEQQRQQEEDQEEQQHQEQQLEQQSQQQEQQEQHQEQQQKKRKKEQQQQQKQQKQKQLQPEEQQKKQQQEQQQQQELRRRQSRMTTADSEVRPLRAPTPRASRGQVGSDHDVNPGTATATAAAAASTAAIAAVAAAATATASGATEAAFYSATASSGIAAATANAAAAAANSVAVAAAATGSVGVDALTPPLALRTRSSRRRRGGTCGDGSTALRYTSEPSSEPTRMDSRLTRKRVEARVEADTETQGDTPFARFSRMTISSSPLPLPLPPLPPSEELPPVRFSAERDGTLSAARRGCTEEDGEEEGEEEEGRDGDTDLRQWNRQGHVRERGQGIGQGQSPRGRKKTGRTKKLVIGVEAGDGAAEAAGGVARRVGAGRRAVALGKRRHADIREMDRRGGKRKQGVESAKVGTDHFSRVNDEQRQQQHQQPHSGKNPRVKLERARKSSPSLGDANSGSYHRRDIDSGDRGGGVGNASPECATPRQARRTRRWSQPRALVRTGEKAGGGRAERGVGGGGGGGGDGVGGGGVDDPLAPYARIAAETWNDEGLEELLHGSRREGYLDLRRFRKPGWPRPLRVTRLEASHGKRFEEHVLQLLKENRRVEANILLKRLEYYDRNPPHLAAATAFSGCTGGGSGACIPAWYQELAAGSSGSWGGGGDGSGDGDGGGGIEEVVDLTAKEVEVVECYDNEPLDCAMMRVVKKEPGLEEEEEEGDGKGGKGAVAASDVRGTIRPEGERPAAAMSAPRIKTEI